MAITGISVPSALSPLSAGVSTASAVATVAGQQGIAQNFTTFLQLLTAQLRNQNPLDPLDTNQFTQQLVQFAQVEQQMNMNSSLKTLVSLQQTSQMSAALGLLGTSVTVGGTTAKLADNQAVWSFSPAKTASAAITITDSVGQTVYSGAYTVNPGPQTFVWDGRGNNGTRWPDGNYTISITAKDSSGQPVAISTEVSGVVDGIDVTQNPPVLSVGGQNFTLDQVSQIRRAGL